jgi:ABC-2 type transport system permease protein
MAVPLVVVGTLAFLPLGLIVGAVSKTAEAASAIANLITLPMAFLSGALAFAAGLALIASRVVRFGEG